MFGYAVTARNSYPRPSVAACLYHLAVDDQTIFLVRKTVQETFNQIHASIASAEALKGRQYSCQKWLLVREGEMPRQAVLVTRNR